MIEQIASKGHQICTSEHEDEKRANDKERERVAYANGRGKRDEGKKDGIARERKSNDERTSRNKTVISRHFTHERERLADSTCVPALCYPTAVKPSSLKNTALADTCSFDILHTYVPTPWYLCARDVKEMKGKGIIVRMLQILEESCAKSFEIAITV
ncbi:hypothetical protein V1478_000326, partial [Vespula squamosa]